MSHDERAPGPGGDLELALLKALWSDEDLTARELHQRVGETRGIVYTTVAKVLDRLVDKGLVKRRREGRAYIYRAVVARGSVQRNLARELLDRLSGGPPRPAMAALVDAIEDTEPGLLDELTAVIEERRRDGHGA